MNLKEAVTQLISDDNFPPFTVKQFAEALGLSNTGFDLSQLGETLDQLVKDGQLVLTAKRKYARPSVLGLRRGVIRGNERGFAFFIDDEPGAKDLFMLRSSLKGALNDDIVLAREIKSSRPESKDEGEVVQIIKRGNETVVGTFYQRGKFGLVVPDERRLSTQLYIGRSNARLLSDGDKVVVRITNYSKDGVQPPEGIVIDVLGHSGEAGIDILSIARKYNLNEEFPPEVTAQAEKLNKPVADEESKDRLDLTDKIIFTIDGADAKDFDDAVSVDVKPDGSYVLGVHIADVSHYVRQNSALDKEALSRGTSVYLINKVLPMLPEPLSNGICSLNEKVKRLTLTIFMDIDQNGRILGGKLHKSLIKSVHRLTYEDVNAMLERADEALCAKYSDILPTLKDMQRLAAALNNVRKERGSIDMDVAEAYIELDEDGKAVNVTNRVIGTSNRMIEEFMLAANETVAEQMFYTQLPFLYRVHEEPSSEKMHAFAEFSSNLGLPLKGSLDSIHPKQLQSQLERAEEMGYKPLISRVMLRAMQKAKYTEVNLGHFGLALRYYCHFTSPIRRYPDLIIHRIIKLMLDGKMDDKKIKYYSEMMHDIGVLCSNAERKAMEAERDVDDMKKAEYISNYINSEFDGVVSGITENGIYVALDNTIEGMIKVGGMRRHFITYPEHYRAVAQDNGQVLRLGDKVRIVVLGADIPMGRVDFGLADSVE